MSLRLRLTLVSTLVLMVVLTSFGAGVYVLLNKTLHDNLDGQILRYASVVAEDLQSGVEPDAYTARRFDFIAQLVNANGRVLTFRPYSGSISLPVDAGVLAVADGRNTGHFYRDTRLDGTELRVLVARIRLEGLSGALMIAAPRGNISVTLARLRLLLGWAGAIGIVVAALLAWSAARTALRPVEAVAEAAGAIGRTGDLSRRVDPAGEDELGRLTTAFNGMLDRLEQTRGELERTLEGQRQFLADASHELRTPLTTMRGNLEVMQSSANMSKADMTAALRDSIEESERMSRLIEDLLALARSDSRATPPETAVPLGEVTREAVALATGADEASGGDGPGVSVTADDTVLVAGSADLLRRLVANLVENAIKYTPAQGRINVSVVRDNGWAVLQVADTGIGMSDEELGHAFDRFWRSDRSRGERGSGLGLAIAKSVTEEHGGAIAAESAPGEGTVMTVRLPIAQALDQAGPQGDSATGFTEGPAHNGST